jgi:CBS domain-containing protein
MQIRCPAQTPEEDDAMTFVRDVLSGKSSDVWTVGPRDMVYKALQLMAEKNIGAVPVVDADGTVLGVFSERDYARKVILHGKSSQATAVEELMSHPVYCVSLDDTTETCMKLMTDKHIRHLVVCEDDKMIGFLSVGDLLKSVIDTQNAQIKDLENFIAGARS